MQFIAEELHAHLLKCGHRDTAAPVSHYLQQKQLVAMVKLNNHPLWVKSRNISRCNRYVHFSPPKSGHARRPMPALGQKRTHAVQQKEPLFDHSLAWASSEGGTVMPRSSGQ